MSNPADDIARRVAQRLAPTTDLSLPARVERALAEGQEREGTTRSPEQMVILGLATFIVTVASKAWDVYKDLRDRAERQAAAAHAAERDAKVDELAAEVAYLKGLLQGKLGGELDVPRALPEKMRIAAVEAAAEETVAAARRERAR